MIKQVIEIYNKHFPPRTYHVQGKNISISLSPFDTPIMASFNIEKYIIETTNDYICHNTTFMFLRVSVHNDMNINNGIYDNSVYTLYFPISPDTVDIIDSIKNETIKLRQYLLKTHTGNILILKATQSF